MKKNLLITLFLSLFAFLNINSQDKLSIEDKYASYFDLPRESVFLHVNKSTFIKGESIWFKGYVYNRMNGMPFKETTNVYVGIYDSNGKQLQKQIVKASNGYALGSLKLDSTYVTGDYYLKANTNWMRNFNEDDAFIQKIQFLNDDTRPQNNNELAYDLQLLPEGGHLVNGVPGIIGVKLINNEGMGATFKDGILIDKDGKTITDFKSNAFGMARFPITPDINNQYTVSITLNNGEKIQRKLPVTEEKGVVLKVQKTNGDKDFLISIATNKATFKDIRKKPYQLVIHKDGLTKSSPFVFNESEKEIMIPVTGDFLFKGINIITLFDESKNPVAERIVFNNYDFKPTKATVEVNEIFGDSISLALKILSDRSLEKNLSVSVLPSETRAYNQKNTILSEFLLKPYIKGYVDDPGYYFTEVNRRKQYDLDLLLLTQGWSRYDWSNIFNNSPNPVYEFEKGLTLKGRFNEAELDKYPSFVIDESKYQEAKIYDLEKSDFVIPEVYYETDEKVGIDLIKKSGRLKRPGVYVRTMAALNEDALSNTHLQMSKLYPVQTPDLNYELEDPETIQLDEIDLIGKSIEKEDRYNTFVSRNNDVTIDNDIANRFPFVTDLIRRKSGFDVNDNSPGQVQIVNRRRSSIGNQQPPIIYFDDTRLAGDFSLLWQLRTSEIERIVFEPFGVSEGSRGASGVIRIWSRKNSLFGNSSELRPRTYIDNSIGYIPVKKYYSPKYQYSSPLFRYFGVVDWKPNLVTDEEGTVTFNILNTGLREVVLYIEGMSTNGELISTMKNVRLQKPSSK